MKTDLIMASHPRSGSTFVLDAARNFSSLQVYLEIFHQGEDTIKLHLGSDWPRVRDALALPNDGFRAALIAQQAAYLGVLRALHPGKTLTYKVFPGHLPDTQLTDTLQPAHLLLVLRRNILESHISNEIATQIGRWGGVDTSAMQTEFDPSRFIAFGRSVFRFLEQMATSAADLGLPVIEADYLDFVADSPPMDVLKTLITGRLDLGDADPNHVIRLKKQDSRANLTDKVTNPQSMISFLQSAGLDSLLDAKTRMDVASVYERLKTIA